MYCWHSTHATPESFENLAMSCSCRVTKGNQFSTLYRSCIDCFWMVATNYKSSQMRLDNCTISPTSEWIMVLYARNGSAVLYIRARQSWWHHRSKTASHHKGWRADPHRLSSQRPEGRNGRLSAILSQDPLTILINSAPLRLLTVCCIITVSTLEPSLISCCNDRNYLVYQTQPQMRLLACESFH